MLRSISIGCYYSFNFDYHLLDSNFMPKTPIARIDVETQMLHYSIIVNAKNLHVFGLQVANNQVL
jgi:hypothetical protein